MKLKLRTFTQDSSSLGRYYRFAVVDTEKSSKYPENFVCLLPTSIEKGNQSRFSKLFGKESAEKAENLLVEALRKEDEAEVRAEIKKRLSCINPKKYLRKKCSTCRAPFFFEE
jgi:hypothetical protein